MSTVTRRHKAAELIKAALAHHKARRLAEAERGYRAALELEPGHPDALHLMGVLLGERGEYAQAVALLQRAAKTQRSAELDLHLGLSLMGLGRLQEAAASFRSALALKPGHAPAHHHLGNALRDLGRREEAIAAYRAAIAAKPDHVEAYSNLGLIWAWKAGDDLSSKLLELASRSQSLPAEAQVHLHGALGKYYEDTGDFEQAFANWQRAAALRRRGLNYEAAASERMMASIAAAFPPGPWAKSDGHGSPSRRPIFVLGLPRSGTTLIEQILASHPEVRAAGEVSFLRKSLEGLQVRPELLASTAPPDWTIASELGRRAGNYLQMLGQLAPGAARITDKQPNNALMIGGIHLILPQAPILFCRRDLRDVCLSCYQTLFRYGHAWSYDLVELGRYALAFARLMDHWRRVLPGRMLEVDYEALVASPEPEIRRILDHCGLPWHEACLSFHNAERAVRTASTGQVRQPLHGRSVARWRRYERQLQPLLEMLDGRERA